MEDDIFSVWENPNFGSEASLSRFYRGLPQVPQFDGADELNQQSSLLMPGADQPRDFVEKIRQAKNNPGLADFNKGTTTLGMVTKDGVILAVDARATQGPKISSQKVRKIIEINEYLLGTMAGGAADCSFWERYIAKMCKLYELRYGIRPTVALASKMLRNICLSYKGYGLSMGTMVAGCDKNGPHLFYVDNDATRFEGKIFSVGSGSTFAYGILDSQYRFDMPLEEAIDLGKRAIYHAGYRDSYSGGVVRVFHVHNDGYTKIYDGLDLDIVHQEEEMKKKGLVGDGADLGQNIINDI